MLKIIRMRDVIVVDESCQTGGSFKIRGVAALFRALRGNASSRRLVTFSSGNHGIAVALYGKAMGAPVTVVVPEWIEEDKRLVLVDLGCHVVRKGRSASECETLAREIAGAQEGSLLHPYRSALQIIGYTSLWSELAQVCPKGADIVVPVGSGGLLAAGVLFRSVSDARYKIIGVEPKGCASLASSLAAGRPLEIETSSVAAPALSVNVTPVEWFEWVRSASDCDVVGVSDEMITDALRALQFRGIVVDPAAAAAFAWATSPVHRRRGRDVVVVFSGRGGRESRRQLVVEGLLDGCSEGETEALAAIGTATNVRISTAPRQPRRLEQLALDFARPGHPGFVSA